MLLQRGDDFAVLGVDERHGAEFGAAGERGEHLLVIHHERAFVGHEMLEGRDACRDDLGHVFTHSIVPIGDAHVVGIIGDRVLRAFLPIGERLHQGLVAVRDAEVDDHRRAAGQSRLGAAFVIVGGVRAHERHVEMGMRVDAAGQDEAVPGVERAVAPQAFADRLDGLALDQNVGLVGPVRGDNRSAFNDERHWILPNLGILPNLALPRRRVDTRPRQAAMTRSRPSPAPHASARWPRPSPNPA
jgi:hypothetical protein